MALQEKKEAPRDILAFYPAISHPLAHDSTKRPTQEPINPDHRAPLTMKPSTFLPLLLSILSAPTSASQPSSLEIQSSSPSTTNTNPLTTISVFIPAGPPVTTPATPPTQTPNPSITILFLRPLTTLTLTQTDLFPVLTHPS
ncbi:hypothetical protein MMC21_004258 [Puttea exsequens]|nr:hypothetical protein [Puttea exsequens]